VFWKILELLTRLVYARRIRHINRVGEAARLAGQGDFQGALERLDKMEKKLHPEVRSFHALTRGRILEQLGRTEEAEREIIRAAKLDPSNMRAHLDLALLSARRRHFKNARARIKRLMEMAEPEIRARQKRP
jgi:Flp pilus assembly protein TadD